MTIQRVFAVPLDRSVRHFERRSATRNSKIMGDCYTFQQNPLIRGFCYRKLHGPYNPIPISPGKQDCAGPAAAGAAGGVAQILFKIYNYNVYQGGLMQVSKWGNSLAVRLPAAVVDALDLKEGDQIEIRIARERVFEVSRDQSKPRALVRLRKLRRPLPPGFVFDREEANAR
jgi:antitoxin MazE